MLIEVNGEPQQLADGATLTDLIEEMGLVGKRIAVELNLEIVPRSQHAATVLAEGDKLEVVQAIGGG